MPVMIEQRTYYCPVRVMLTGQAAGLASPAGAGECGTRHLNVDKAVVADGGPARTGLYQCVADLLCVIGRMV